MKYKREKKLNYLRRDMDKIDEEILRMLAKRFVLVQKIMKYKKLNRIKLVDKEREKQILKKVKIKSRKYKISEKSIENIFKSILKKYK